MSDKAQKESIAILTINTLDEYFIRNIVYMVLIPVILVILALFSYLLISEIIKPFFWIIAYLQILPICFFSHILVGRYSSLKACIKVIIAFWIIVLIFLVIFLFSCIYFSTTIVENGKPIQDGSDAFYFSIVTFTTLGYGDFQPPPEARFYAATESILGYIILGIFVATTINILQSYKLNIQPIKEKFDLTKAEKHGDTIIFEARDKIEGENEE